MNEKPRCQSCGMPIGQGWLGTESDGSASTEYCVYCYKDGEFTDPDLTLDGMVRHSVAYMTGHMKFTLTQAEKLSSDLIPKLKRWK